VSNLLLKAITNIANCVVNDVITIFIITIIWVMSDAIVMVFTIIRIILVVGINVMMVTLCGLMVLILDKPTPIATTNTDSSDWLSS